MDLCDLSYIRPLLTRHGFRFSKSMGQNFLIDAGVPERIAASSGADKTCGVLEIGPGVGCLTGRLCERAGRVVSVELDRRLIPVLGETMAGYDNLKIVEGDIMKLDLPALVAEELSGLRPIVCANLPYNITTPVITRLIELGLFSSVTVMVQREVALRICAAPGSADYGAFTLLCSYYSEPELLFNVPSSAFEPRPKVESAVVTLTKRNSPQVSADKDAYFRAVRAAFNMRRKTLVNALSSAFPEKMKDEVVLAVKKAGLDEKIRGEALSAEQFSAVTEALLG